VAGSGCPVRAGATAVHSQLLYVAVEATGMKGEGVIRANCVRRAWVGVKRCEGVSVKGQTSKGCRVSFLSGS